MFNPARATCFSVSLILLTLGVADARAQMVFVETDGYVVIEAESTRSAPGAWKLHKDASFKDWVGGFTGRGCLQFTGNRETSGPPNSELTYLIWIKNPGKYKLAVRGLEAPLETGEGDKANDCYVRMDQQPGWLGQFTKCVQLGKSYQWSWNVKSEYKHHKFEFAEYDLKAGGHAFQIAGRSKNFFIDRFVLYKDLSEKEAQSEKLEESPYMHVSKAKRLK